MSQNGEDGEPVGREVAYRLFATEYDDSSITYTESDEERAPNYVISPTGARINRLFAVGTLTEVSPVNEEMVRARVVDPTGAFVVYAGQYQPEALAFLERADPPEFVAITGKARTFQPDDSEQVYTSVRPESIATVDADTRDRWVVDAAERTLDRIETYAAAAQVDANGEQLEAVLRENGFDEAQATGIAIARDEYGTTPTYLAGLRDLALDTLRVVAGDLEQVERFDLTPSVSTTDAPRYEELAGSLEIETETVETGQATATSEPVEEISDIDDTDASSTDSISASDETESDSSDESPVQTAVEVDGVHKGGADADDSGAEADENGSEVNEIDSEAGEIGSEVDESGVATESGDEISETDALDEGDTLDGGDTLDENDTLDEGDTLDAEDTLDEDDTLDENDTLDADVDSSEVGDELGDFDAGGEMYEMDDEERAEIEAEYGADFTTGTEVDEPGTADIDTPDPSTGESSGSDPESETDESVETDDAAKTDEKADAGDTDAETGNTDVAEIDLEELVVETMRELDDGDGADRSAVVEQVVETTGASETHVEDAIEDALMGGQCYEPDEETLKPI